MSVDVAGFEAILFDCDGVLVDSETIATHALHQSLQDIGMPMLFDQVAALFTGESFPRCVMIIEDRLGHAVPDDFVQKNRDYFHRLMNSELVAMPGIKDVLSALNLPYAVVTNSQKLDLDIKLKHTRLDNYFPMERRFDIDTTGVSKPNPDIYRYAAAGVGVDIKRCLIVEDSYPGISAGVGSGATVWGYRPHLTDEQLHNLGVKKVFSEWSEFLELMDAAIAWQL